MKISDQFVIIRSIGIVSWAKAANKGIKVPEMGCKVP